MDYLSFNKYGGAISKEFASLNFVHQVVENSKDFKTNLSRLA